MRLPDMIVTEGQVLVKFLPVALLGYGGFKWAFMPLARHIFETFIDMCKPHLKRTIDEMYKDRIVKSEQTHAIVARMEETMRIQQDFNHQMFTRVEGTMDRLTDTLDGMREEMGYWRAKFEDKEGK